jgi:D-alanyl-D-alanine carboxypeptidase
VAARWGVRRRTSGLITTGLLASAFFVGYAHQGGRPATATLAAGTVQAVDSTALTKALGSVVTAGSVGAVAEVRDSFRGTWNGSSGKATRTSTTPPSLNAHFHVASISKTFNAVTVLQLAGEGKLSLSDTVESYLPGLVTNGSAITIRMLLNHTSGVYSYHNKMPTVGLTLTQKWTPTQLAEIARDQGSPYFAPGTGVQYSNTDFVLLAMIVEKVTGQSYSSQVQQRIIGPLGLTGTSVPIDSATVPAPNMHGYQEVTSGGGTQIVDVTEYHPSRWYGTADVISTVTDINTFYTALLDGHLLPAQQLTEMKTTVANGERDHGLGIFRWRLRCGVTVWGHDGNIPGHRTWSVHSENGQRHLTLFHSHLSGDLTKPGQDFIDTVFCRMPMGATGNPADGPATIDRAPNLAYVYTRDGSGHLIQRRWDGSAWLRTDLGGAMRSNPAAASDSAAEIRAFTRGGGYRLATARITGTTAQWADVGPTIRSAPAAVSTAPGEYHAFARSGTDTLAHTYLSGGKWTTTSHGGSVSMNPVVLATGPGDAHVFYRASNGHLYQAYYTTSGWKTVDLGGAITSSPAAISYGPGHGQVFARGTDGHLWMDSYKSGWKWQDLGQSIASAPAVLADTPGTLHVFVTTPSGHLLHGSQTNGTWTWEDLGGAVTGTPGGYLLGEAADPHVFAGTSTGHLQHAYRPDNTWTWQDLGT